MMKITSKILLFLILTSSAFADIRPSMTSFNAGELTPLLHMMSKFDKYDNGCSTLQNMLPLSQGPVFRRPGTYYIASVKTSTQTVRLIPFEYSKSDAYILEFGDLYIRFYRDGGQILNASSTIYEITSVYAEDELFDIQYVQSADVMYLVNGSDPAQKLSRSGHTNWTIENVDFQTGPFLDESTLTYETYGLDIATTQASASVNSSTTGNAANLFDDSIVDPDYWENLTNPYPGWAKYDFGAGNTKTIVKYTMSAGAGNAHRLPSKWLFQGSNNDSTWTDIESRDELNWVNNEKRDFEFINENAYRYYRWYFTENYFGTDELKVYELELMVADETAVTIAPSQLTGTCTLTATANIFTEDHEGSLWQIRHPRTDTTLSGSFTTNRSTTSIDCEGDYNLNTHGTWTGTVDLERSNNSGTTWEKIPKAHVNSVDDDNADISGTETESGYEYRITSSGWVSGTCTYDFLVYEHMHTGVAKIDTYYSPTQASATIKITMGSTTASSYWSEGYWSDKNGWPQTVEFHEFRLWFGGSNDYPQTLWSSKIDDYNDMTIGTDDDDALIYTLPGQNPIQWLLSHSYLMIGTLGGAGRIGEQDEAMAPTIQPQYLQQSGFGSKYMQAVLAGDAILYIERGGEKVREFVYSFERDRFVAPDMTVLAEHITGDGITNMAYQSRPDSILWSVRADGDFLSMTYNRPQEVVAWAHHVTDGDVESMAVIPGTGEDEVWLAVERTINSSTVRYIERMMPHDWGTSQSDCFFVDSGLTWNGGDTVNISNASQASPCVITVAAWPTDGDGDNLADDDQIKIQSVTGMTELNGNIYTISSASVTGKFFSLKNSANTAVINSASFTTYTSTGTGTVQRFENTFTGFDHLEGESIPVLADGAVQDYEIVTSGSFTLSVWCNKMSAGLPYTSILKTMPIVVEGAIGAKTKLSRANINFYQSLGTLCGLEGDTEEVFTETSLVTDWKYLGFQQGYTRNAHIYLEQVDPLPLTIRAIVPSVVITEN